MDTENPKRRGIAGQAIVQYLISTLVVALLLTAVRYLASFWTAVEFSASAIGMDILIWTGCLVALAVTRITMRAIGYGKK